MLLQVLPVVGSTSPDDSSIVRLFRHLNVNDGCYDIDTTSSNRCHDDGDDDGNEWTEQHRLLLNSSGYCVVPSVVTTNECDCAIDSIWLFLNYTTYGRIQRDDPTTWSTLCRRRNIHPATAVSVSNGIDGTNVDTTNQNFVIDDNDDEHHHFKRNGAGFILSHVHEVLADRLFTNLFGTSELHTSKEGFYFRPEPSDTDSTILILYCQQQQRQNSLNVECEARENLPFIRSVVAFEDVELTLHFKDPKQSFSLPVLVKKGDTFLWRTDGTVASIHVSTQSTLPKILAILFVTMQPATCTPPAMLPIKMEAYKQRETGTFRLDVEEWIQPVTQLNHDRLTKTRQYYDTSPPLLTMKQAQLYGLVSYHDDDDTGGGVSNDDTSNLHDRQQRAIIRGVRFKDADLITSQHFIVPPPSCDDDTVAHLIPLTTNDPDDMIGQDKYLGGMASPCQRYVYGVPGGAKRVLRIRVSDGNMDCIGPSFEGKFKWLRGVTVSASVMNNDPKYPDGCCLALPCNSASVLKINPTTSDVYIFGEDVLKNCGSVRWHYHGGNVAASNGWLYAIPANANRVVKINPVTDEVVYIGPTFHSGGQKWFGGITGTDGCIYGIPHNETSVLKIDPRDDAITLMTLNNNQPLPVGQWKWHGGLRAGDKIYGFPNNADTVLVINCREGRIYTINSMSLSSGRHRIPQDNRYKYLGGATTLDQRYAYLFPCDAERVLRIDCQTDELRYVGPHFLDGENKFQNGFVGRDGCVYGIPQRALSVLRITPPPTSRSSCGNIDTTDDIVEMMDSGIPELIGVKDKFEGGVLGPDGCIYCIPLRSKVCIQIIVPGKGLLH